MINILKKKHSQNNHLTLKTKGYSLLGRQDRQNRIQQYHFTPKIPCHPLVKNVRLFLSQQHERIEALEKTYISELNE